MNDIPILPKKISRIYRIFWKIGWWVGGYHEDSTNGIGTEFGSSQKPESDRKLSQIRFSWGCCHVANWNVILILLVQCDCIAWSTLGANF